MLEILFIYIIILIITIVTIIIDKQRESSADDNFSGGNLFYRYGKTIISSTITIGIDGNNNKPLIKIAEGLILYITNEIKIQFNNIQDRFKCDVIHITDRKMPSDQRTFIKTTVLTKRKSEINYFILIVGVGNQIVIHEYLYLKGKTKWLNTIAFIITAPLHIWFWFYPWLTKNYSVYSNLKKFYNKSSFDLIDIITVIRGLSFLFSTKLKLFAKNEGLLTEDLNMVLNQNISNSQHINISNSKDVTLKNITGKINM